MFEAFRWPAVREISLAHLVLSILSGVSVEKLSVLSVTPQDVIHLATKYPHYRTEQRRFLPNDAFDDEQR